MTARFEVLALGCCADDLAVLAQALTPSGIALTEVDTPRKFARDAVSRGSLAVVVGVSSSSMNHLEVVSVIRAIRSDLPVLVIAEDDSLELERSARQAEIFYYFVHPIDRSEVDAVIRDLRRRTAG